LDLDLTDAVAERAEHPLRQRLAGAANIIVGHIKAALAVALGASAEVGDGADLSKSWFSSLSSDDSDATLELEGNGH
jgi:hypothetical protein